MRLVATGHARPPGQFRRLRVAGTLAAVAALWLSSVWWAGGAALPSARARAAPSSASATAYLPFAAEIPGDFRQEATVDVGGLREPDTNVRRVFVSADGSQTIIVEVAIRPSIPDAESRIDGRVNQMVRYQGWLYGIIEGLGDRAFRGAGLNPDGQQAQSLVFRVRAIAAEVALIASAGDPVLVDYVARLVEERMRDAPDATVTEPGFVATPRSLPGKDPPGPLVISSSDPTSVGNAPGGPGGTDTIVLLTLMNVERPWTGTGPRPPQGFTYLTTEVLIEVGGPTAANVVMEDFVATTLDGREWPPVLAREPAVRSAQSVTGTPVHGWLTFAVPSDQQALQLIWRLRSAVSLSAQGGGDQALVVPLTVGSTATASLGTPAPPAGRSVDPNSPVPPGSAPLGPSVPSSAPSGPATTPRGGTRLQ
jgi:hypothetical protein